MRDGPHGYSSPQGLAIPARSCGGLCRQTFRRRNRPEARSSSCPAARSPSISPATSSAAPAREILYPDPGFPPYRDAARSSGAKPVPYPIREEKNFGFDAEEVLSLITPRTALIMINSPANPTGGVVDAAEMKKLAAGLVAPSPCRDPLRRDLQPPRLRRLGIHQLPLLPRTQATAPSSSTAGRRLSP